MSNGVSVDSFYPHTSMSVHSRTDYCMYMILIFFTLDSSAQFIVSRRCWDFASAGDEIFKQKFFRFSLQ